ncbi:DctP family TRAP transporter solute-binding subunit [Aquipuribacter nitratireducens]|uniref:DctP family TRAP transporter solute-binding subunit n=1 Tax=Aquipuribacter nitratireducens TaxID=650104 RepID=A0ABW0GQ54_9MICO
MSIRPHRRTRALLSLSVVALLALAACGDDGGDTSPEDGATDAGGAATTDAGATDGATEGGADEGAGGDEEPVELSFANSYPDTHPHNECGAFVVRDTLGEGDSGISIEVFSNSQLGPDAERFTSVASGDIDIDIQGSSAISASFPEIGALDAAYAFEGPDALFEFVDSPAFEDLQERMLEATGVRVLDVWYFGMRHFTANQPIRTSEDFSGLRMRFPDSPQYLANAEALGATAVPVAFEEVYLALQQGTIDGQENPIPTIRDLNLPEVQSHVSLTGHQVGSVLAIVSEDTWQSLSQGQQEALQAAISETRDGDRQCVEDAEAELVQQWQDEGTMEVVEDVDREAFAQQAEEYFMENYSGDQLALYEQIREIANQ